VKSFIIPHHDVGDNLFLTIDCMVFTTLTGSHRRDEGRALEDRPLATLALKDYALGTPLVNPAELHLLMFIVPRNALDSLLSPLTNGSMIFLSHFLKSTYFR